MAPTSWSAPTLNPLNTPSYKLHGLLTSRRGTYVAFSSTFPPMLDVKSVDPPGSCSPFSSLVVLRPPNHDTLMHCRHHSESFVPLDGNNCNDGAGGTALLETEDEEDDAITPISPGRQPAHCRLAFLRIHRPERVNNQTNSLGVRTGGFTVRYGTSCLAVGSSRIVASIELISW
jgi:hypothetical protein